MHNNTASEYQQTQLISTVTGSINSYYQFILSLHTIYFFCMFETNVAIANLHHKFCCDKKIVSALCNFSLCCFMFHHQNQRKCHQESTSCVAHFCPKAPVHWKEEKIFIKNKKCHHHYTCRNMHVSANMCLCLLCPCLSLCASVFVKRNVKASQYMGM